MNLSDDKDYDLTLEYKYQNEYKSNISVINGVEIQTDGDVMHFRPIEENKTVIEKNEDKPSNPLSRIWNWYKNAKIKPYVKIRDFNHQGMDDFRLEDNEPHCGAEIGIRFDF